MENMTREEMIRAFMDELGYSRKEAIAMLIDMGEIAK